MNSSDILAALDLPEGSSVDRRVPKKLLLENAAVTATDKRSLNEGIEELLWIAALKPTTIAVPAFRDDVREYLEIAVLRLTTRPGARSDRLVELIHRAIPYPVLLILAVGCVGLSLAHKRWAINEKDKVVLDDGITGVEWDEETDAPYQAAFCDALQLGRQPHGSLHALYQGWMDAVQALEAARITGAFVMSASVENAIMRRAALKECYRLSSEIMRLGAEAAREKQIARQVELNLELQRVKAAFAVSREKL
jgi:hypothetical protein